jgi:hypothetical protein
VPRAAKKIAADDIHVGHDGIVKAGSEIPATYIDSTGEEQKVDFDRLQELGLIQGKAPESESPAEVVVPEGVVPGETPGWPVDAETGKPLDLTDEQRRALIDADLERQTNPDL